MCDPPNLIGNFVQLHIIVIFILHIVSSSMVSTHPPIFLPPHSAHRRIYRSPPTPPSGHRHYHLAPLDPPLFAVLPRPTPLLRAVQALLAVPPVADTPRSSLRANSRNHTQSRKMTVHHPKASPGVPFRSPDSHERRPPRQRGAPMPRIRRRR